MEGKCVLSCINGFKPSEAVIDYGSWFANKSETSLKLFHAIDILHHDNEADFSGSIGLGAREDLLEEFVKTEHEHNKILQKRGKLILEAARTRALQNGVSNIDECLRKGKVIENILDLKEKISVVVLGKFGEKHQTSYDSAAVGHKVEGIVRSLEKPVLIVSEDFKQPQKICLAFDASERAKKALSFIVTNKSFKDVDVQVVYVGDETDSMKSELDEAKKVLGNASITAAICVLQGDVGERLSEITKQNDIDLFVMGAFGHSWLRDMVIGSLTSKLISQIQVPVLLVR